jgi:hypothetical protein
MFGLKIDIQQLILNRKTAIKSSIITVFQLFMFTNEL